MDVSRGPLPRSKRRADRRADVPSRGARSRVAGGTGHTFVELLIAMVILAIMAGAVLPVAAISRKRQKEIALRRELRDMRAALDMYHQLCGQQGAGGPPPNPTGGGALTQISQITIRVEDDPDRTCYPKDLDVLIEGVETNIPDYKLKFLRRIPHDPLNVEDDEFDQHGWSLRSTTDRVESEAGWNRRNVFDVHSGSDAQAIDGSYYKTW